MQFDFWNDYAEGVG